jgi:hypothetical protein
MIDMRDDDFLEFSFGISALRSALLDEVEV